jgi:hypothetical protein
VGESDGVGVGTGDSVGPTEGPVGKGEAVGVPKVGLGVGARDLVGEMEGVGVGAGESVGVAEGRRFVGEPEGEGEGAGESLGEAVGSVGLEVGAAVVGRGVTGAAVVV